MGNYWVRNTLEVFGPYQTKEEAQEDANLFAAALIRRRATVRQMLEASNDTISKSLLKLFYRSPLVEVWVEQVDSWLGKELDVYNPLEPEDFAEINIIDIQKID